MRKAHLFVLLDGIPVLVVDILLQTGNIRLLICQIVQYLLKAIIVLVVATIGTDVV